MISPNHVSLTFVPLVPFVLFRVQNQQTDRGFRASQ